MFSTCPTVGACITKHFADFNVLLVGRLLGGIATSILYSAFESWLVYEHNKVIPPFPTTACTTNWCCCSVDTMSSC